MDDETFKVIIEEHEKYLKGDGGKPADFTGANLSKRDFTGMDLRDICFARACLKDTVFHQTDATGARFSYANLWGSRMTESIFDFALFQYAVLTGSDISLSKFNIANFFCASLSAVSVKNSLFAFNQLRMANLYGAFFEDTDFHRVDFTGANLTEARFRNSKITTHRRSERLKHLETTAPENSNGGFCGALLLNTKFQSSEVNPKSIIGADLTGATLPEGWNHASVGWTRQGEPAHYLRGLKTPEGTLISCGPLFEGTLEDFRVFIDSSSDYRGSLTKALNTVLSLLEG